MDILSYKFMQNALIVGFAIAIMAPVVGNFIVIKRMAPIGDSLSHGSLAGVLIGLFFGINPMVSAILFTVCAVIIIEITRHHFKDYSELTSNIIMGLGVGITGVLMNKVNSDVNVNTYIFGSLVTVSKSELVFIVLVAIFVVCFVLKYKNLLLLCILDENSAVLMGIDIKKVNFIFMLITAVVIAIASKIVGALIVTSLTVIPVACAMQISKSFNQNIIISVIFSIVFVYLGIVISYYFDLVTGGTTILVSVTTLLILLLIKAVMSRYKFNKRTLKGA